ncbi:Ig-like domain-containing protein [Variovorax sp. N23]|uniref:Ig-like domain-containing protein n=1 Tax=Variovorax sp. N23 TaxID=2980555 RepID=UPI0021CA5B2A|nr:Ig-like domain-containing protein [Variovorax sp. N23]MCU4121977.1 Ig-like domain-containing protein [Variovorax sp. N23]
MSPSTPFLSRIAGRTTTQRPLRRTSQLLSLEQRFMFDGAAVDAAHAAEPAHDSAPPPVPPAVEVRAPEPARDQGKKEVVLVDTSLADYKTLEAGVREGVGIVEFDGTKDGLAQIAAWAASQEGYDAIHILSHGSEGVINLGSMQLNQASLVSSAVQTELTRLGQALSTDGDLLLYGCDVGAGAGSALLSGIAKATGADVAASTDTTGAARLGGNWTLEAHDGTIDARELALTQYDGALTLVPFIYGTDADESMPRTSIVKTVSGHNITFTGPEMYLFANGTPDDGLYPYASDGSNGVRLTVTAAAGYSFDISSFGVQAISGAVNFNITWADGTTSSFTQSGFNMAGVVSTVSGFNTALDDMRSVTITSSDYTTFQNFNITDVKLLPPVAKVNSASLGADTGTSGSDFITNTAAQLISGTLSANLASGEKVQVSYDNGSTWSDATTYTVGTAAWSTTTTLAGNGTFVARVANVDATSTAYTHTYTLDTAAPTTSFSGIALSADTGTSSTDLITKTASQTITATLSGAPAGTDVVWGSVDGGSSWIDITSKVSGTTLSWNGATLGAGSNSIMLKVTDAAGNDSSLSFQNYTLDTTAPTKSVATAAFSNDSGSSSTDFITSQAAQTVSGTLSANLASGETVYVSLDNGATWSAAAATVGTNAWSLAGRTLTASNTLRVKVSDTAGNDGAVLSQAYVYDTTAPTTTFGGLALSADTGASSSDFITRTAAQTISATLSGTLAGGDILYGSLDGGATWTDITGKLSGMTLTWNGVTLGSSDTLQLKVVDAAGNEGAVRSRAYVLDTSAPATPGTPVLASGSDGGISNSDGITNDSTPTFTGTAESGSTVSVYDGATLLGTVVATGDSWNFTAGSLSQGGHTITAVSTDTAGNASAASAGRTITIDTTAPAVNSVAVPANNTYYSGDALDFTVNFNEAVIVDTTGGTPRIAMVVGATTRYASYVAGSGSSALIFRYTVVNGDTDSNGITVGALSLNGGSLRDTAGNDATTTLNSVGSTVTVLVDGSQPSVTAIGASTADGSYGAGAVITITVDFSSAVTVDTSGGTPTLALGSGGSATYTGGSGSSTLSFSYVVAAGQNSADLDYSASSALALNGATITEVGGAQRSASVVLATPGTAGSLGANKNIVIDTAAPTTTVADAAFSADSGSSGSDFVTNTAAQTISGTLSANLASGEHVYVSLDNGASWAQAAASAGSNSWSLAGQTLTGSNTLRVRVVDDAGNIGAAYAQAYVLDTTAPSTGFSNVALSADTGVPGDLITNTAAQTISATLSSAPAAGDVVYGSLDNGATWTDITSQVSGTTLSWTGVTLAGSNTLRLRVTDQAGNNGAATSRAYVLDTTGPTTSVASVAFSGDSGASSTDFITNIAAQSVSGTLSANLAAGETVMVSLDNGATWSAATATVGSTAWSLAGQTLSASNTLQVKVVDTAGNDGAVLSQAYVYDTAATVPTVDPLSTTSLTPVLGGTATLAAGETMTVSVGGATYDVTPTAGAWRLDLSTAVPVSGTLTLALNQRYEVVASVTDLAGNSAADATVGELTLGTAPATTVTGVAFSADQGASASDFVTNAAGQTISGGLSAALAAGESVQVSLDGGSTWRPAAATVGSTQWSIDATLPAGSGTLAVRVSNAIGGGTSYRQAYVLDTTAPASTPEGIVRTADGVVQGSLSAPLSADETLFASRDGGQNWFAVAVDADRRAWSLSGAGDGAIQLRVTDLAGNTGPLRDVAAVTAPAPAPAPAPTPAPAPAPAPAVPPPVFQTPPPPVSEPWLPPAMPPSAPSAAGSTSIGVPLAPQEARGVDGWQSPLLQRDTLQPGAVLRGGLVELLAVMPGPDGSFVRPDQALSGPGPMTAADRADRGEVLLASAPIQDLTVRSGGRIDFQLGADTFVHGVPGAVLQLSARTADGRPLPAWLKFDARTGRFEGVPPSGFSGTLTVQVMARDAQGREALQTFRIVVERDGRARVALEAGGRSSLNQQLREARGTAHEGLAALAAATRSVQRADEHA